VFWDGWAGIRADGLHRASELFLAAVRARQ